MFSSIVRTLLPCLIVLVWLVPAAIVQAQVRRQPPAEPRRPEAKPEAKSEATHTETTPIESNRAANPPERVVKTDAEWRRLLTPQQFYITRQKGTEQPFSGKYNSGRHKGVFLCVCCDAPLFSSNHKFDSGTGWPSFYKPVQEPALASKWDYSGGQRRMEVLCRRCDAHLGHVFPDGPPPTGLRYCINSLALRLVPFPTQNEPTSNEVEVEAEAQPAEESEAGAEPTPESKPEPEPAS